MTYINKIAWEKSPQELRALIGEPNWTCFDLFTFDNVAAIWFAKWFDGAEVGVWMAEGHRHSTKLAKQLDWVLRVALEKLPVVVAYTQQPRVLRLLARLGFVSAGTIPAAHAGKPVTMYWVTRNSYRGLKHGTK